MKLYEVCDERISLKEQGVYEAELVKAYFDVRTNYSGWSLKKLEMLFAYGDRQRIREAGDPIPEGEKFTLYRGVAGKRPLRKVAGFSWTSSLKVAVWFATRDKELHDPAIYTTTVSASEVLCYINEREEQEFLLRAKHYKRLSLPEIAKKLGATLG